MTAQTEKTCPKCKRTLPLSSFHKSSHTRLGVQTYCKECNTKICVARARERRKGVPPQRMSTMFRMARRLFGTEHQLEKIVGECGEYVSAWSHYKDGRPGSRQELLGELADIFITAWQARLILGAKDVDRMVNAKLEKMGRILAEKDRETMEATAC